jgi:hypothetical protein
MINGDAARSRERIHEVAVIIAGHLTRLAMEDDAAPADARSLLKRYRATNHLFWADTGEPVDRTDQPVRGDRVLAYAHGQLRTVDMVVLDLTAHPYWDGKIRDS